LDAQLDATGTFRPAEQHLLGAFSVKQQLSDLVTIWQQPMWPLQPHDAAGKPCPGIVIAASQISVRTET